MDINDKINAKQFINEIDMYSLNFGIEPIKRNYILVSLTIKSKSIFLDQMMEGTYYCNDCKTNHFQNPCFENFKRTNVVKNNAIELQKIHDILYK